MTIILSLRTHRALAWFGRLLMLASIILLICAALGRWTSLGNYPNGPALPDELYDPALVARTNSVADLLKEADAVAGRPVESLPPAQAMDVLYRLTASRFTHGDQAKHNIFSNWIMWGTSLGFSNAAFIQTPDAMLKYGHSALCGQVAWVLISLARTDGIPTRLMGIQGHNFMEAWYENKWHLYDPDRELVPRDAKGEVLSLREICIDPALALKYYATKGDDVLRRNQARDATLRQFFSVEYLAPGDYLQRNIGMRYHLEIASFYLIWILPAMGIGGSLLVRRLLRKCIVTEETRQSVRQSVGAGKITAEAAI